MKLGELSKGQFAVIPYSTPMAVLRLSDDSFPPTDWAYLNVVNVANGIGSFLNREECRVVEPEEAFRVALAWLKAEAGPED